MSRFYCRDEELRKLNKRYENTVMKKSDYFRHRNAEKYSCLPLPIFLNNTRNALAGVKLAGAFLVEVIIKDL